MSGLPEMRCFFAPLSRDASAVVLLQALVTELNAVANDPAAVTALANRLQVATTALSAAVAAVPPAK